MLIFSDLQNIAVEGCAGYSPDDGDEAYKS